MVISVLDFIEDFDNSELPDVEWREALENAVIEYNSIYDTNHDPAQTFGDYACKLYKDR